MSVLGLYDYGARFYSTLTGRFVSADPLVAAPGDPQMLNRYAYVRDNPLTYLDPTGLYLMTVCGWGQDCEHGAIGGFRNYIIAYWQMMGMFGGVEDIAFGLLEYGLASGISPGAILETFDVAFLNTAPEQRTADETPAVEAIFRFTGKHPDLTYAIGFSFGGLSLDDYLWAVSTGQRKGPIPEGALLIAAPSHHTSSRLGHLPPVEETASTLIGHVDTTYSLYHEDLKENEFNAAGLNVITVAGMNNLANYLGIHFTTDARDALTVEGALNLPDLGNEGHQTHQDYAAYLMHTLFWGSWAGGAG